VKRLLALIIAVGFLAGAIGCTGGTTTAPKVAPITHKADTTLPTKRIDTTLPTHAAPETKKTELPPVPTTKETKKETKKD
jgi:hypothetical protein